MGPNLTYISTYCLFLPGRVFLRLPFISGLLYISLLSFMYTLAPTLNIEKSWKQGIGVFYNCIYIYFFICAVHSLLISEIWHMDLQQPRIYYLLIQICTFGQIYYTEKIECWRCGWNVVIPVTIQRIFYCSFPTQIYVFFITGEFRVPQGSLVGPLFLRNILVAFLKPYQIVICLCMQTIFNSTTPSIPKTNLEALNNLSK